MLRGFRLTGLQSERVTGAAPQPVLTPGRAVLGQPVTGRCVHAAHYACTCTVATHTRPSFRSIWAENTAAVGGI